MATTKTILKTWFETGKKPTQAQFSALIDAFKHVDDESSETLVSIGNVIKTAEFKSSLISTDCIYISDSESFYGLRKISFSALKLMLEDSFEQSFDSSTVVEVRHNLKRYPSVVIMDSSNRAFVAQVTYPDIDSCVVSWVGETSGKIICN